MWTNYKGQPVEFTGTVSEGLEKGYNYNCVNCSYCSYCSNCSNCSYCSYCSKCSNCSDCSYCSYCSYCSNCSDCSQQPIVNIMTTPWNILIRANNTIKIGCQNHTIEKWLSFDDDTIKLMEPRALEFWKIWKPVIQLLHVVTGHMTHVSQMHTITNALNVNVIPAMVQRNC